MSTTNDSIRAVEALLPHGPVRPLDASLLAAARARVDSLAKPLGSLGRLEEIACRLAAMAHPMEVEPALMFTVAGDHGVVQEGVAPFPQEVTRQMVQNFLDHGAGINALTRASGMDLVIVDAGCAGGPFASPEVVERRLGDGTADMARGPAMSRATCLAGIANGIALVADAHAAKGLRCVGFGEMGIGNSTPAAALYSCLLGLSPEEAVGPGAGAGPAMVAHKAEVLRMAFAANADALAARLPDGTPDPLAALACVGGFEIATMCGIVLGAASLGLPVLVDGFIASSAYAVACLLCPAAADYCFVSHASAEPGHVPAMERLAARTAHPEWAKPLLSLGMRLGEGTGAAVAYHLLRCAVAMYTGMASFESAGVSGPR